MVSRIVEPILFGFLFVVLFWFSEKSKNTERKLYREKMRFWVAFATWMTFAELASTWHNEIGLAWQKHPDLTIFGTLIVFAILNALAPVGQLPYNVPGDETRRHSEASIP